jgi:hypothetical protein
MQLAVQGLVNGMKIDISSSSRDASGGLHVHVRRRLACVNVLELWHAGTSAGCRSCCAAAL